MLTITKNAMWCGTSFSLELLNAVCCVQGADDGALSSGGYIDILLAPDAETPTVKDFGEMSVRLDLEGVHASFVDDLGKHPTFLAKVGMENVVTRLEAYAQKRTANVRFRLSGEYFNSKCGISFLWFTL